MSNTGCTKNGREFGWLRLAKRRATILPLPGGEGRGEGALQLPRLSSPPAFDAIAPRMLRLLLVAGLSSLAVIASAAELTIQLPPEVNSFKQDVGAEIANAQCLICHSVEYISTQPKMQRAFWKA